MRIFAALTIVFAVCGFARADYMLDDFEEPSAGVQITGTSTITDGEGNSVDRTVSGNGVGGGQLFSTNSGTSVLTYDYGMSSIDPNANLAVLRNFATGPAVGGTPMLTITTTSSGGIVSSVDRSLTAGSTSDVFLNITSLSNIQDTATIQLSFDNLDGYTIDGFEFVSVPEPASIALATMAIGGIGGAGYARRRRKGSEEEASV